MLWASISTYEYQDALCIKPSIYLKPILYLILKYEQKVITELRVLWHYPISFMRQTQLGQTLASVFLRKNKIAVQEKFICVFLGGKEEIIF